MLSRDELISMFHPEESANMFGVIVEVRSFTLSSFQRVSNVAKFAILCYWRVLCDLLFLFFPLAIMSVTETRGGLMVSAQDSGSRGLGSSPTSSPGS